MTANIPTGKRPAASNASFTRILAALALLAALACAAFPSLAANPGAAHKTAELTPAEQAYLENLGPVSVCVDPDWIPFEWVDETGVHQGIAADLLRLAAERVGARLRLVPTKDWDESLAASRQGRCLALSFLNQTPQRDEWLLFTEPLFTDSNVFITREEHPFIDDPAALMGESIVFPKGTSMEERIRRDYPNLKVIVTDTEAQALDMVSERKADMTLRSLIIAAYTIRKEGYFNLKIAGRLPDYANRLRIGVSRSEPMLRDILDKGVATITAQERGLIVNRHVAINVQDKVNTRLVLVVTGVFSVIAAVGFFWNLQLKRLNRELEITARTDPLTGLPNRLRIDTLFRREIDRAQRYGRPLSIVLLDVDRFKRVNDELGHLMGDAVLKEVVMVARRALRSTDTLGRWGGEEFLVLCPETGLDEAVKAGERLREAVKAHAFPGGRVQTVSAGVASLGPGDSADCLLMRADKALYQAKNQGRDKVCGL